MKNAILISAILASSTAASFAQVTDPAGNQLSLGMSPDTVSEIKSFTVTGQEGQNCLNWKAAQQHADGVYFIYRSSGSENDYQLLAAVSGNGLCVKGEKPYSFTDRAPTTGYNYYKILHIARNNTYVVSEQVQIVSELLSSDQKGRK